MVVNNFYTFYMILNIDSVYTPVQAYSRIYLICFCYATTPNIDLVSVFVMWIIDWNNGFAKHLD